MRHFSHSPIHFKVGDTITDDEYTFCIIDTKDCKEGFDDKYTDAMGCLGYDTCIHRVAIRSDMSRKWYCLPHFKWRKLR
jgi:hypothetical protein